MHTKQTGFFNGSYLYSFISFIRPESILLKSALNRPPGKHINFDLIAFSCSGKGSLQSNL